MASRPCLACGVPADGRYCPDHVHLRYRNERWKALSARLRRLYGCAVCGTKVKTQVHHKRPLAQGGAEFELTNLQVLCDVHHAEAHAGR